MSDCPLFQLLLFSGKVQAQFPFQVDLPENTILCLIWIHPLALRLLTITGKKFACFCPWLIIKFFLPFALIILIFVVRFYRFIRTVFPSWYFFIPVVCFHQFMLMLLWEIEQLSVECCKIKTKVFTVSSQSQRTYM